jgi:hypothetical protein
MRIGLVGQAWPAADPAPMAQTAAPSSSVILLNAAWTI